MHIDSALAEIATLKERLAETERARDQADAKCRELSEENEGLKREVEELTSQAATLTARIRVLEQENITLTERQQALETANASLEAQQMATAEMLAKVEGWQKKAEQKEAKQNAKLANAQVYYNLISNLLHAACTKVGLHSLGRPRIPTIKIVRCR